MNYLFFRFFEIATLQKGPQDLPGSQFMTALSLALFFVSQSVYCLYFYKPPTAILFALGYCVILYGFIFTAQSLRQLKDRANATISAIAGAYMMVNVASFPLLWLIFANSTNPPVFAFLLFVSLQFWTLVIFAHTVTRSLNIHFAIGISLAIMFSILSNSTLRFLMQEG